MDGWTQFNGDKKMELTMEEFQINEIKYTMAHVNDMHKKKQIAAVEEEKRKTSWQSQVVWFLIDDVNRAINYKETLEKD
jgi:hypothetical protein